MAPDTFAGMEQPLERLPAGGPGWPVAAAIAIAATVVVLAWQPWAGGGSAVASYPEPQVSAATGAERPISAAPSRTPSPPGTPADPAGAAGLAAYLSLTDNEWTVVALLSPDPATSTEEPAGQHGTAAAWSSTGPFLVLQQGLSATADPIGGRGEADLVCQTTGGSRDRFAVHLPAGRVAYLGVTFPGMNPATDVTAATVSPLGAHLRRVPSVVVRLQGGTEGQLYRVPSSGSGGAALFATRPARPLPSATYRFDVMAPGTSGPRHLYACIGS